MNAACQQYGIDCADNLASTGGDVLVWLALAILLIIGGLIVRSAAKLRD